MATLLTFKQKQNQENLNKLNNNTKKKKEKNIKFKVFSFAKQSKPVAPLGPTLGQFNINLNEFCTKFNELTKDYFEGLYLTCCITKKLKAKEFNFKLNKPTIKILLEILLSNLFETDQIENFEKINQINIELIYDLVLIYSFFDNFKIFNSNNLKKNAKIILSYLNSINLLKIIKF